MRNLTNKIKTEGFTLMELLVYMALMGLFMMVLLRIFASSLDTQLESQATTGLDQDGRYMLSRLTYDISHASTIITPATLGTSSATLQISVNGVQHIYSVTANKLNISNDLGLNAVNSVDTTVSNFSAIRYGNSLGGKNTVRVSFTLTATAQQASGARSKTFQTTIGVR